MRGFLVLAGVLVIAAFVVAPEPLEEEHHEKGHENPHHEHEEEVIDSTEQGQDQKPEEHEAEDNVFASVETAATNADLSIKLMKQALGVLLESSANAMESTEELLRSGVYSVNSIASGAQAAAKQIGIAQAPKPVPKVQGSYPVKETKKPERQRSTSWFGW